MNEQDKEKMRILLSQELAKKRKNSFSELKDMVVHGKVNAFQIISDGNTYDIELQYFWDNQPDGNIRVLGTISDKSLLSSIKPVSDDFIMTPDGSFIGE